MLNTITRTGKVLAIFDQDNPQWGVREAAVELGWPRSTTHQVLTSLASIGLLQQNSSGKYRLGWRILTLSKTLLKTSRLEVHANAFVHKLATSLKQTVTIGTWDGHRVISLASYNGHKRTQHMPRGTRLPGHASALGKILMSSLDESEAQYCVDRFGLPRLTERTNSHESKFFEQLDAARSTGVAFDSGETHPNRYCIAVPILGMESETVAAISISTDGNSMRLHQQDYNNALKGVASRVTRYLVSNDLSEFVHPARQEMPVTFDSERLAR